MALVECAGSAVMRGEIHQPLAGQWYAALELATDTVPTGQVTLEAADGVSIKGTVVSDQSGVFNDTAHARIVGGAGGLATKVSGTFRGAQLRDPLGKILSAAGETQSTTIDTSLLSLDLPAWSIVQAPARRALDNLAKAATAALGSDVHWRVLDDGTIWIGTEAWPTVTLAGGDAILAQYPGERRTVVGAQAPSLVPGVNLDGVGNLLSVVHWILPSSVRSWVWA